jgi:hypothetical protein
MRADDWYVEAPRQIPPGLPLPRELVIRWVGDSPVIAGVSRARRMP